MPRSRPTKVQAHRAPDPSLSALLAYRRRLGERGWRGLVWIRAPGATGLARAHALWQARDWQAPLWIGDAGPDPARQLAASKARTRLGGEHDLVIVDARSEAAGFDPEAFGALSGTLRAGGLLGLITSEDWGARPDADYARLAEHPWRPDQLTARYLARLARRLAREPAVIRWQGAHPELPVLPAAGPVALPECNDPDCLTADQAEAVARLTRLRRRRPLVLTADRGRGKTAALGIACARLLARSEAAGEPLTLLVTAPRPGAVTGLFARLDALCPQGERRGNRFEGAGGRVQFLAPDALSAQVERGEAGGPGGWLLVDEAAAIPAALLGQWLTAFPRIAFATTLHGYEGSGRGFALRFRERLERLTPGWRALHLAAPIRWAAGDPLEATTTRLLLLDAEPPPARRGTPERRVADQCALARDEPRLRALFGLLVQAHYRTSPADLRRLLDGPTTRIVALEDAGDPQAVVVTGDEGGFASALAERVARGERRPRGHLLAQSLAAHAGERAALTARLRRISRIAVHPERRREGLGRHLLDAEREAARADGIDLLGASFGAEPALMAFWQSCGFRAVRLGLTRETATGEHALMMVAPVSPAGEVLAERLVRRFRRQLPGLLAFELRELAPDVALALLAEAEAEPCSDDDVRDLADVAYGHREPALARPALQGLAHGVAVTGERGSDLAMLVAWAFQGRDTAWLARQLGVSGGREVTAWLRGLVARLLDEGNLSKAEDGR